MSLMRNPKQPNRATSCLAFTCAIALLLAIGFSARSQSHILPVFNSQGVQIGAGKYLYVDFTVGVYLKRARLAGNVMARGGGGNDIIIQVVKDGNIIFDSAQLRSVVIKHCLERTRQVHAHSE